MYEKKGQATGAVSNLIVLIVGVGVAVLVLIFVGSLGGQTYELVESDIDAIGSTAVANESFTGSDATAAVLNHADIHSTSVQVWNSTNAVNSGNYTISYAATPNTITLTDGSIFNNTALTIDYTYGNTTVSESIKQSVISSFSALETTGDYVPIIVLAVVVALVLAIVLSFGVFGKGGAGKGSVM